MPYDNKNGIKGMKGKQKQHETVTDHWAYVTQNEKEKQNMKKFLKSSFAYFANPP